MAISVRYPGSSGGFNPMAIGEAFDQSFDRAKQARYEREAPALLSELYGGGGSAGGVPASVPAGLSDLGAQFQQAPDPSSQRVSQAHAASGGMPPQGAIESYIRHAAQKRGIDPEIAVRVAMSEGGVSDPTRQSDVVKNGVREQSYGPFQLYMGGGLGNEFQQATGLHPSDPAAWRQGIDFALDKASQGGWGPWYGAAKAGIGNMDGIGGGQAAPAGAPQPQQMAQAGGFNVDPDLMGRLFANPVTRPMAIDYAQKRIAAMQDQNDPMKRLAFEKAQLEIEQMRSGRPSTNSSFGNLDAQARAAGLQPGTPEYQDFMLNGGGAPSTFRALDMQAQAAGFQPGTPEYNEFMATRGAGLQAGAAQTAKNEADINTGGPAAGAKEGGKKSMEAGFEAWSDYGKLRTSLGNLDEAIAAIDDGAKSGMVYNMLPNVTEASASLKNAMDRMGLDVVGSVTFGALSKSEMDLAMETAAPRNLQPAELRKWLVRKRDAQQKASEMLADAAQFLTVPGNTINDWIARNRAANEVGAAAPAPSSDDYRSRYGLE